MNSISPANLTIEQQFRLKALSDDVKKLTLPQAQDYLIEVITQNMVKDNLLRQWIKG